MLSAAATTSVSSAAITEPIAVSATVQRRVSMSVTGPPSGGFSAIDRLDRRRAAKSPMSFGRAGPSN